MSLPKSKKKLIDELMLDLESNDILSIKRKAIPRYRSIISRINDNDIPALDEIIENIVNNPNKTIALKTMSKWITPKNWDSIHANLTIQFGFSMFELARVNLLHILNLKKFQSPKGSSISNSSTLGQILEGISAEFRDYTYKKLFDVGFRNGLGHEYWWENDKLIFYSDRNKTVKRSYSYKQFEKKILIARDTNFYLATIMLKKMKQKFNSPSNQA